jgi:hypothetical protein
MGFEAPRTVYQMDFADTEYAGLEVAVRATTVDELLTLMELIDGRDEAKGVRRLFGAFADILVGWNVTRDGHPVPTDEDGLLSLEEPFATAIILAWQRNLVSAPPPLPGTSPSGKSSPEALLATASKSRSPENF